MDQTKVLFNLSAYDATFGVAPYIGIEDALIALWRSQQGNAFAQREASGLLISLYQPLAVALAHVLQEQNLPPFSAQQLFQLHQDDTFFPKAVKLGVQSCHQKNITTPYARQEEVAKWIMNEATSIEVARVIVALVCDYYGRSLGALHLGTIYYAPDTGAAALVNVLTCGTKEATATVWLLCEVDLQSSEQICYGLCSAQGMHALADSSLELPLVGGTSMHRTGSMSNIDPSPSAPVVLTGPKRAFSAEPTISKGGKRIRRTPTELQVNLPSDLTATDILHGHPERLSYTNLLRVAVEYSNTRILEAINQYHKQTGQKRIGELSAVAHRVDRACEELAKRFELPKEIIRNAVNTERRKKNIQSQVTNLKPEEGSAYREKIDSAVASLYPAGVYQAMQLNTTFDSKTGDNKTHTSGTLMAHLPTSEALQPLADFNASGIGMSEGPYYNDRGIVQYDQEQESFQPEQTLQPDLGDHSPFHFSETGMDFMNIDPILQNNDYLNGVLEESKELLRECEEKNLGAVQP